MTLTEIYEQLDPEIAELVLKLREAGFNTFSSCQGGTTHAFQSPTIRITPKSAAPADIMHEIDKLAAFLSRAGHQGYYLEDYLYCLDLYRQAGLIRPYMAVGSVCQRSNSREIVHLVRNLYYEARERGIRHLHYFGLKLSPALEPVNPFIYSRDSAVAMMQGRLAGLPDGRRYPRGQGEKKRTFFAFKRHKVDRLSDDRRVPVEVAKMEISTLSDLDPVDLDCMADDGLLSWSDMLHLASELAYSEDIA